MWVWGSLLLLDLVGLRGGSDFCFVLLVGLVCRCFRFGLFGVGCMG